MKKIITSFIQDFQNIYKARRQGFKNAHMTELTYE